MDEPHGGLRGADPASLNIEGYGRLFRIENALRELIVSELHATCGPRWWKERVPGHLKETAKKGKDYEASQPWTERIVYHPIYYLNYPELRVIIEQKHNWREVFLRIFKKQDQFSGTLAALEPARNRIAHNRFCLASDIESLSRAEGLLLSCVGRGRMETLLAQATCVEDGDSVVARYCQGLIDAHRLVAQAKHLDLEVCSFDIPGWLLDEALSDKVPSLERLVNLYRDYAQMRPATGSALRLRNWSSHAEEKEIFMSLGLPDMTGEIST